MSNVFTPQTIYYIEKDMCIDSQKYIDKISQYEPSIQKKFTKLGTYLLITNIHANKDLREDPFNINAYMLLEKYDFDFDCNQTAENIIDSFSRYKKYGLLALYTGANSDLFDPLPRITTSLYLEMGDIEQREFNNFSDIITIYRGTSLIEYNSKIYSQSWTLDKKIANDFAYKIGKSKYLDTERVIIKAEIYKNDIYAYILKEQECIINSKKIISKSIELVNSKLLI